MIANVQVRGLRMILFYTKTSLFLVLLLWVVLVSETYILPTPKTLLTYLSKIILFCLSGLATGKMSV